MSDELDLLRRLRPPAEGPDPELARLRRSELMTEITRTQGRRGGMRERAVPVALSGLAVAATVVVALLVLGRGSDPAWAGALVRVAERSPRLLVDDSSWRVTRADQFSPELGEMTFADGERTLDLHWEPASEYARSIADRSGKTEVAGSASVPDGTARVFRYDGTNDFTALWVHGDHTIEVRGVAASAAAFKETVGSLREVSVDRWLSAMPDSVVKPASRAGTVRQMLAGVPLPDGLDTRALRSDDAVRDRYQLGALVSGTVACAWIERWVAARAAGDAAGVRAAVTAMAGSREWPILQEMNDEGDYPEVLWQYADAMAGNDPIMAGKELSLAESYRQALGCTDAASGVSPAPSAG